MTNPRIKWLSSTDPADSFPALEDATTEPDGLLAAGGDLSSQRLLCAYSRGIFPWFEKGQPILWWSPDPRCVLRPGEFHISRSLRRTLNRGDFEVSFNHDFDAVIEACAEDRDGLPGTWITAEMMASYRKLHLEGWAHSIEVWHGNELAGGMYGLAIGKAFFGESMFSRWDNASKTAMAATCRLLVQQGFLLLDCQLASPHLHTLGATLMPRPVFAENLAQACEPASQATFWPDRRISTTTIPNS